MSFDLFVLVEKFDASTQSAWVERMSQHGVACVLPAGFTLDPARISAGSARCSLGPPLVATALPAEEVGIDVSAGKPDSNDIAFMRRDADPELARRLSAATIEFHFESSAGRSDASVLFQCYGAAALADVTGGVLVDPQAAGPVHGLAVYAVAKANSDWALPQPAPKSWWERLLGR